MDPRYEIQDAKNLFLRVHYFLTHLFGVKYDLLIDIYELVKKFFLFQNFLKISTLKKCNTRYEKQAHIYII